MQRTDIEGLGPARMECRHCNAVNPSIFFEACKDKTFEWSCVCMTCAASLGVLDELKAGEKPMPALALSADDIEKGRAARPIWAPNSAPFSGHIRVKSRHGVSRHEPPLGLDMRDPKTGDTHHYEMRSTTYHVICADIDCARILAHRMATKQLAVLYKSAAEACEAFDESPATLRARNRVFSVALDTLQLISIFPGPQRGEKP